MKNINKNNPKKEVCFVKKKTFKFSVSKYYEDVCHF